MSLPDGGIDWERFERSYEAWKKGQSRIKDPKLAEFLHRMNAILRQAGEPASALLLAYDQAGIEEKWAPEDMSADMEDNNIVSETGYGDGGLSFKINYHPRIIEDSQEAQGYLRILTQRLNVIIDILQAKTAISLNAIPLHFFSLLYYHPVPMFARM